VDRTYNASLWDAVEYNPSPYEEHALTGGQGACGYQDSAAPYRAYLLDLAVMMLTTPSRSCASTSLFLPLAYGHRLATRLGFSDAQWLVAFPTLVALCT
jgi:hypothetical protein